MFAQQWKPLQSVASQEHLRVDSDLSLSRIYFCGYCDEGILSSGDNIQVKLGRIMAMKAEGKNKV